MTAITREWLDALDARWPDPPPYPNQVSRDVRDLTAALRRVLDLLIAGGARWSGESRTFTEREVRAALAGTQTDDGAEVVSVVDAGSPSAHHVEGAPSAPSSPDRIEAVARAIRGDGRSWTVWGAAERGVAALDAYDREHDETCPPAKIEHHRVGPARCACGYDAYKVGGFFPDYHAMFMGHLARATTPRVKS